MWVMSFRDQGPVPFYNRLTAPADAGLLDLRYGRLLMGMPVEPKHAAAEGLWTSPS